MANNKAGVTIIAGGQSGDEAKGKEVDRRAATGRYQMVIRGQGGPNAGHTIVNEFGEVRLHMIPSGICSEGVVNVIGPGCVVDPVGLIVELEDLLRRGVVDEASLSRVLAISEACHLILPHHTLLDQLDEESRGREKIGSTLRGVGPAYTTKAAREGFQAHLLNDGLKDCIAARLEAINRRVTAYGHRQLKVHDIVTPEVEAAALRLKGLVRPLLPLYHQAAGRGAQFLLEGQLGLLKGLDDGIYPDVTSSNTSPAGIYQGSGLPFGLSIVAVVGVIKAYLTTVGSGAFPTCETGETADQVRKLGKEVGATTGRPRDFGWLDMVQVVHAIMSAGFTELMIAKLDVIGKLPEVKICTAYRGPDGRLIGMGELASVREMAGVSPVYQTFGGWESAEEPCDIGMVRRFDQLPARAQIFISSVSQMAGIPVTAVGVGPHREQTIVISRGVIENP